MLRVVHLEDRELEDRFCSEDTQEWVHGAHEVGLLAVKDPAVLQFMCYWLAQKPEAAGTARPDEGDEPNRTEANNRRGNIHRFRHSYAALASYMSESGADKMHVSKWLDQEIRQPLTRICIDYLIENGQVSDLTKIPGLATKFDAWRGKQLLKVRAEAEMFRDGGNQAAYESKVLIIRQLEGQSIPEAFRAELGKIPPYRPWVLASYLAGIRTPRSLLGLPLLLIVKALRYKEETGSKDKSSGLPYVLNLPIALKTLRSLSDREEWDASAAILCDSIPQPWIAARTQYNNYIIYLEELELSAVPGFMDMWSRGIEIPGWLKSNLVEIASIEEGLEFDAKAWRIATRTMRRIATEYFHDEWQWNELSEGEQFTLNAYALLAIHGPEVLTKNNRNKGTLNLKASNNHLQHRITLLVDAIQAASHAKTSLRPTLVRCLAALLYEELRANLNDKKKLMWICRRQLLILKPLMADWCLPGSTRKLLATILARVLVHAFRAKNTCFVELLYTTLFAFPDNLLFNEMIEFTTEDELGELFDCIRELIEELEKTSTIVNCKDEETKKHCVALYEEYAERVKNTAKTETDREWIRRLPNLVCDIANVSGNAFDSRQQLPPPFDRSNDILKNLLAYGQRSKLHWQNILPLSKFYRNDLKGQQEAVAEQEHELGREARVILNRFQFMRDNVRALAGESLPEIGNPRIDEELTSRWRKCIRQLDAFRQLCSAELPYLERKLCILLCDQRIQTLRQRLQPIIMVVDREREDVAKSIVSKQARIHISQSAKKHTSVPTTQSHAIGSENADAKLIQDWMLKRYMIRELADGYGLRVLKCLTSRVFVPIWIMAPFLACIILHVCGLLSWRGIPFAVISIGNLLLLFYFSFEARQRLPEYHREQTLLWRFMLPQTTAAILVGVIQTTSSDESWSMAITGNPVGQTIMCIVFLTVGFFFTREILLRDQFKGRQNSRRRGNRAWRMMMLSLWQSFALVLCFSVIAGRTMAGLGRADIDPEGLTGLAKLLAEWVPTEVHLGACFLQSAASRAEGQFWLHPRAILSWTVQVFFFSAIFERVMQRQEN